MGGESRDVVNLAETVKSSPNKYFLLLSNLRICRWLKITERSQHSDSIDEKHIEAFSMVSK